MYMYILGLALLFKLIELFSNFTQCKT